MKYLIPICFLILFILTLGSCRTAKRISKAIATGDTTSVVIAHQSAADSLLMIQTTMDNLQKHRIDYKTFNAKIKVDYQDSKGKQSDLTAIVRIIKDSSIWISLTATILNFEAFRLLLTRDSVILMDKRDKSVKFRSIDYLQDVTQIPFDYKTIQDLLVGNPIFMDSNIVSYKRTETRILVSTVGNLFKHLLTISADNNLLLHSKLDDIDVARNRTADITYSDFENKSGVDFSTYREITVSEKNKLDIQLNYKQYEFNKELSVSFNIPKNYKRK